MGLLRISILFLAIQVLPGCYLNSSISRLDGVSSVPSVATNRLTTLENVSGSSVYTTTLASGYRVKQSAGLILNKQLATTQNGYRVYLNVTGRLTSTEGRP